MNTERNGRYGFSRLFHFLVDQVVGGITTAFNIVGVPTGDGSLEIPANRKQYHQAMAWLTRIGSILIGFVWVLVATIDTGEGGNRRLAVNLFVMDIFPFIMGTMGVVGPLLISRMRRREIYAAVRSASKGLLISCSVGSMLAITLTQDISAILIGWLASMGALSIGILFGGTLCFVLAKLHGYLDVSVQQGSLEGAFDPDSGTYPN